MAVKEHRTQYKPDELLVLMDWEITGSQNQGVFRTLQGLDINLALENYRSQHPDTATLAQFTRWLVKHQFIERVGSTEVCLDMTTHCLIATRGLGK